MTVGRGVRGVGGGSGSGGSGGGGGGKGWRSSFLRIGNGSFLLNDMLSNGNGFCSLQENTIGIRKCLEGYFGK